MATADAQAEPAVSKPLQQAASRGVTYTAYGANSWEMTFHKTGATMLVDPWLVGELVFADQRWLFEGRKGSTAPLDVDKIAAEADFILLSQGLPDHAHEPTLARLPKDMPVVASPAAARIAERAGFKQVYELAHGQDIALPGTQLRIRATAGALVGPPWSKRENGFIVREEVEGGLALYYEPHCDSEPGSFADVDRVDVVVAPCVNQNLGFFPLVQGNDNIEALLARLRPRALIPLVNADFPATGPLSSAISQVGDVGQLPQRLQAAGLGDIVIKVPSVQQPLTVDL